MRKRTKIRQILTSALVSILTGEMKNTCFPCVDKSSGDVTRLKAECRPWSAPTADVYYNSCSWSNQLLFMTEICIIPVWYFWSFPRHLAAPPTSVSYPDLFCSPAACHLFRHAPPASPLLPPTSSAPLDSCLRWFSLYIVAPLYDYTALYFQVLLSPLLPCVLSSSPGGKGVFSARAWSTRSCSVFCLTPSLPPLPLSFVSFWPWPE